MGSPGARAVLVRFGPFELDLQGEQLRRNGARIRIQQQPFLLLATLVESPGEIVTREELRERLWPDGTFVDFEHGLNTAVKKIRLALHDSTDRPRYVETVRGRGYRFLAPVTRVDGHGADTAGPTVPSGRSRKLWLVVAGAAGAVVVLVVAMVGSRRTEGPSAPQVVPLTSYPGQEYEPTFSPDGSHVAFVWRRDGADDIYVQPVDVPQPRPLADAPEIEHSPAWSPDGRWIAFIRDPAEPEGMARVLLKPPAGGPERLVTEYPGSRLPLSRQRQLAWTPDARHLVLSRPDEGQSTWSLFRVDVSSGQTTPLTTSPERDVAPAVSPDGRTLTFGRQAGERGTIQLLPLSPEAGAAGPVRTLVGPDLLDELGLLTCHMPAWTPDGQAVVFAAYPPGPQLYVVNVSGTPQVVRVPASEGALADMTFCPRTGRLAYALWRLSLSILRLDLRPGGTGTPVPAAFNSTQSDLRPLFSPDGSTVAFVSGRRGGSEIWLSHPDGSGQRPLASPEEGWHWELSWSPDGGRIAYAGEIESNIDVYIASVAGSRKPLRLTRDPGQDREPCWSPDGLWIYFTSTRDGRRRIWRMPAEGGPPERVTEVESSQPALSADGRFLYFARGWPTASVSVWRMPTTGGKEERVLESVDAFTSWRLTREGIYFFEPPPPGNRPTLFFHDLASSRTRRVAIVDGPLADGLTVSRDGKTLFFTRHDDVHADLMLRGWP